MQKPTFDPGLTEQYTGTVNRIINKDGQFNVHRSGSTWRDLHPYLVLVNMPFPVFLVSVTVGFMIINSLFAWVYLLIGPEHVKGLEAPTEALRFLNAFFFSAHTLTTVGYGNMYPVGVTANFVAVAEALVGLLTLAIATGLLFGRFSRPSARIGFSNNLIVAPYQNGISLQFRVVNRRSNNLINLEARVLLMTVELVEGRTQRRFLALELERSEILFFPLTWTVVHPIDERSPLYGKTPQDLERLQAEVMIIMRAFDDTSGQSVHARYSYRYDEITWGARFVPAFAVDDKGDLHVAVNSVGAIEKVAVGGGAMVLPERAQQQE